MIDVVRQELEDEFNGLQGYWSEFYAGQEETKESLDAEAQGWFEVDCVVEQDAMEARGGPAYCFIKIDDIPF